MLAALQRVGGSHGPLLPGGASGGPDRLQGHVLPTASPGLCRVLARFPRGHGLRQAGCPTHWRPVRDEDVVVHCESAAWDVAVTWSGLMWAVAPQPWPARERAALTLGYLRAVADWVVLQTPARWSRLMRAGEREWPVAGSWWATPSPVDPAECGACPDVVLHVGARPSVQGAVPEVVLARPATSRALFPGYTLQSLGDGPQLAFPAGAAPPGVLAALGAFFPVDEAPPRDQLEANGDPEPWAGLT